MRVVGIQLARSRHGWTGATLALALALASAPGCKSRRDREGAAGAGATATSAPARPPGDWCSFSEDPECVVWFDLDALPESRPRTELPALSPPPVPRVWRSRLRSANEAPLPAGMVARLGAGDPVLPYAEMMWLHDDRFEYVDDGQRYAISLADGTKTALPPIEQADAKATLLAVSGDQRTLAERGPEGIRIVRDGRVITELDEIPWNSPSFDHSGELIVFRIDGGRTEMLDLHLLSASTGLELWSVGGAAAGLRFALGPAGTQSAVGGSRYAHAGCVAYYHHPSMVPYEVEVPEGEASIKGMGSRSRPSAVFCLDDLEGQRARLAFMGRDRLVVSAGSIHAIDLGSGRRVARVGFAGAVLDADPSGQWLAAWTEDVGTLILDRHLGVVGRVPIGPSDVRWSEDGALIGASQWPGFEVWDWRANEPVYTGLGLDEPSVSTRHRARLGTGGELVVAGRQRVCWWAAPWGETPPTCVDTGDEFSLGVEHLAIAAHGSVYRVRYADASVEQLDLAFPRDSERGDLEYDDAGTTLYVVTEDRDVVVGPDGEIEDRRAIDGKPSVAVSRPTGTLSHQFGDRYELRYESYGEFRSLRELSPARSLRPPGFEPGGGEVAPIDDRHFLILGRDRLEVWDVQAMAKARSVAHGTTDNPNGVWP